MTEAVRERGPFTPVTVAGMIGVGVVAFGLMLVLSAYAPDLRSGRDGRGHALSRSAVGYAGLVQLMREQGVPLEVSRSMGDGRRETSLEVYTPEFEMLIQLPKAEAQGDALGGDFLVPALQLGTVVIVLPKWATEADGVDRVRKAGPIAADSYTDDLERLPGAAILARDKGTAPLELRGVAGPFREMSRLAAGQVEDLQTISGRGVVPLVVDGRGRTLLARMERAKDDPGKAVVYMLSDPDLLNNHGLRSAERARAADVLIRGLRPSDDPIIFDLVLNGFESSNRSLLKLAFQPPFLAATLCALAAALLAGWQAAVRFGPPRLPERALAFGKAALADNAAGLIRLAKREHRFGGRYAAVLRDQAAEAVGLPRELSGDAKAEALDRMGRGERFTVLAAAAERAGDRDGLLTAARDLHRWKTEIARGS